MPIITSVLYWILSLLLLAFSLWIIGLNAFIFWKGGIRKERVASWTPLLGGVTGAIGLALIPAQTLHGFWWAPLFLDWGSIPGIGHAIAVHMLRKP